MSRLFVLIVEDEKPIAAFIMQRLVSLGISVVVAHTLADARQLLEQGSNINCIIADGNLPDGTSFDLIRQVRARNFADWIFGCSGSGEDFLRRMLDAGCDKTFAKPHELRLLLDAVLEAKMVAEVAPDSTTAEDYDSPFLLKDD